MGSSRLLRRLIRNLLENARRHGAPPIEIALETRDTNSIRIHVIDHGKGVPEAERQRVFEPFYRPSGAAESGGSWGLGLALVARIASLHHGRVTCGSAPSGGAMFTVELSSYK
jgi:signal transduction histidine kinase